MTPDKISSIRAAASDMAEECNEISSAATSTSPTDKWWPSNSLSSWINNNTTTTPWKYPQNPNYSSNISLEVEEGVSMSTSFTNASSHSGLTLEPSRNELIGETPSGNHLWNHVLLNVGNNSELQNKYQDVGENMISAFSRKNLSNGSLFDPACDYLKKLDNGWDLSSSTPFNNFKKSFNGCNDAIFQPEKRTKLSNNSVSNWSIAPPDTEMNPILIDPLAFNISLSSTSLDSDVCYMKACVDRKLTDLTLADEQIRGIQVSSGNLLQKSLTDTGYQTGIMNNVMVADNSKFHDSNMTDVLCNDGRNYADVMSFTNFLSKPWMNNINAAKPILKSWILSDCKKQALQASFTPKVSTCNTVTKGNRRGQVLTNEGKKKRSEGNSSDAVLKMPKQESSLAKSLKVPKAKLGDKITALQQIVSPFGKTDTASVLWEAIGYIKFLQEHVQLLSNPYMKTNAIKDPWGATNRKDRVDLKSRGLCLVPVSCTPQVYSENAGPDYLTAAYRGCLYR